MAESRVRLTVKIMMLATLTAAAVVYAGGKDLMYLLVYDEEFQAFF